MAEILTVKEASEWASKYLGKNVTTSNISYLIQYGRIKKIGDNGFSQVLKDKYVSNYCRKFGDSNNLKTCVKSN